MQAPDLHWDDDGAPQHRGFADRYYSRDGGAAETEHVFLAGNRLAARFRDPGIRHLCIGELGFGSGLNFLLTWALFRDCAHPGLRLHYWSVERQPLRQADLARSLRAWPQLAGLAQALLRDYTPPVAGLYRRCFDGGRVTLDCVWADAGDALEDLASQRRAVVDAWYLDGFAPSRNSTMWRPELFQTLARCSRPGATLASYSAAGGVRRALAAAGFAVHKRPGYGRKRECINGHLRQAPSPPAAELTPWDLPTPDAQPVDSVLIVGAGLAGAHVAAALARRGIASTVLDAGRIAGEASGNAQGILFNRLSHRRAPLGDFSLAAFLFASAYYNSLFEEGRLERGRDGDLSGCFQLPGPRGDAQALKTSLRDLEALAQPLDTATAAQYLGVAPVTAGFWQPCAGWLSAPRLCRALLEGSAISLREHCPVAALHLDEDGRWTAVDAAGRSLQSASAVVIAAGTACSALLDLEHWLPVKPIRGQTTQVPLPDAPPLRAAFCHSGYIAPAVDGEYCLGASFQPGDTDMTLRSEDHEANIAALRDALPGWRKELAALEPSAARGRVGLRCASPDYLPLLGPDPAS